MVTYVALLMLLQMGMASATATLCSALLFVPWVLKSFMRPWVYRVGNFREMLLVIEALLFVCLVLLAFSFNLGVVAVFFALFFVSLLCAWHELTARMYYESALRPSFRRLLTVPKHVCSGAAVIFTYGALIFLVGTLEVYFRQISYSWSLGCYVTAGLFLLLSLAPAAFFNRTSSRATYKGEAYVKMHARTASPLERADVKLFLLLFLLLLPQALMFFSRVLYLYDAHARGGLQCTIQEIGFAQGTVGVIAFSLGIALGRRSSLSSIHSSLFWLLALCLVLSPFVYLGMTIRPPQSLLELCLCTMTAQLLFGLGIGVCRLPIGVLSGTLHQNTSGMLRIPFVAAAMFVPMAISGWMVERLGYDVFFLVNALSAPVCLLGVFLLRRKTQRA